MGLVIRELAPNEVPEGAGVVPGSLVMGVIEDNKVVALLGAFTTVFLDPLWCAPEFRGHKTDTLYVLWKEMKNRLRQADVHLAIGHAARPAMARVLTRLGGREVAGKRQFVMSMED